LYSSPRLVESKKTRLVGRWASIGEQNNVIKVLAGKVKEVTRPHERPRRGWKDSKMGRKGKVFYDVDLIRLA
jgi:hypothetical protein